MHSNELELTAQNLMAELDTLANPSHALTLHWFFRAGPGEYGEGDEFLGIKVPIIRQAAKPFRMLSDAEIEKLIQSRVHEHRFAALAILNYQFEKARDPGRQEEIFNLFLKFVDQGKVNNWDLVDGSANRIGAWLVDKPYAKDFLVELAKGQSLWHTRVAVIFTMPFIRQFELDQIYVLAKLLMNHEHDLIHKAVGWMLREAGKQDLTRLRDFLAKYSTQMPRVMLRYSIEKLSAAERKQWLQSK